MALGARGNHPMTIHAKVGLYCPSGFRIDDTKS